MKKECEDCGKCCLETDMIVSEQDTELILNTSSLGHLRKKDFTFSNREGYFQLKNIEDYCYFFDVASKSCIIYEHRPQGCRFYPLVYDREKKVCVLDIDCPNNNLFYQDPKDLKAVCNHIRKFLREQLKMEI